MSLMSLGKVLFWLVVLLIAMWFFIIWLPHGIQVIRIGIKYGWPAQKRAAIQKLFLDGTITHVGYVGGSNNPNEEFVVIISGPFGAFVRRGTGAILHTAPDSAALPPTVAAAFGGYLDQVPDVVWLLWYLPFLGQLQEASEGRLKVGGDMPQSLAIAPA